MTIENIPNHNRDNEMRLSLLLSNVEVLPMGETTIVIGGLKTVVPLFYKTEVVRGWTVVNSSVLAESTLISEKEKNMLLNNRSRTC